MPSNWRFKLLNEQASKNPYSFTSIQGVDLLALSDGWLNELPFNSFQTIREDQLRNRLNRHAVLFLSGFRGDVVYKILPISFTPWVMLFRHGEELAPAARESWKVLLDPSLKGHLVLPRSARLIMSIADRMGYKNELKRLRNQAITLDDQYAMNWILSGKAKVAVVPLQYCMDSLVKDPRLSVALPKEGAPLNWVLVAHPKKSSEMFPTSWVNSTWELPLMGKLISKGWIPPLPYSELLTAIDYIPKTQQSILFDSEQTFDNFWSIAPLDSTDQEILRDRWLSSTP